MRKPYMLVNSPFFLEDVCIVPTQDAYNLAIDKWDIINKKIPTFSEKELVFLTDTINLKTNAGRCELLAIEKIKKLFHGAVQGIPKDYDHDAVVLERLAAGDANVFRAAEKAKKKAGMEKLRRAANGVAEGD